MILDRRTLLSAATGLILAGPALAQPRRIPFEFSHDKIFVPVFIGDQPVQAMLDSGSQFTGMDAAFAAHAGIAETGRRITLRGVQHTLSGRMTRLAAVAVGGTALGGLDAVVLSYESLSLAVGRPVEMALGVDFFRRFVVEIDFQTQTLALHERAAFVPPPRVPATALTARGEMMTVPIAFPGGITVLALIDTGSAPPLILSPMPAAKLGLFKGKTSTAPLGGVGGASVVKTASAPNLGVGGAAFRDVPVQAASRSLGVEANLGLGLLSRFHLYFDFAGSRAWFAPPASAAIPPPFKRDYLGVYGPVEGETIRVTHVSPGSPAAAAGFRAGEIVTAINGEPAATANRAHKDAPAGTVLTLTLKDGRTRTVTLARYY